MPKPPKAKAADQPLVVQVTHDDVDAAIARQNPATAARSQEAWDRFKKRPEAIKVTLEKRGSAWAIGHEGDPGEQALADLRRLDALGTSSTKFMDAAIQQLFKLWEAYGGASPSSYGAALAILESAKPENELEAMLVIQMIASHTAAMRTVAQSGRADFADAAMAAGNLANKFMRTFTTQMEALAKLRRGGEQVVKYVHVHEGGQAVVAGTINQGGRAEVETSGQPCRAGMLSECAAVPCSDPARHGVPVPGDAEREMSHPRREEPGRAEGQ